MVSSQIVISDLNILLDSLDLFERTTVYAEEEFEDYDEDEEIITLSSAEYQTRSVDVTVGEPEQKAVKKPDLQQEPTTTSASDKKLPAEFYSAINFASWLNKNEMFSTFNEFHLQCASALIDSFSSVEQENYLEAIKYAASKVNKGMFNYALAVVTRHIVYQKEDGEKILGIQVPSHITIEPEMYIDIAKATEQALVQLAKMIKKEAAEKAKDTSASKDTTDQSTSTSDTTVITITVNPTFTGTDMEPEHRVSYFREDIGVNLHHRHWHEVYPFSGKEIYVKKDRRGELFYYMHEQIVARYNFERFCTGLTRVKPFSNFRSPIGEACFPKLDTASNIKLWCPRQKDAQIQDIDRNNVQCKVEDLERWRERILETIDRGYLYKIENGEEKVVKMVEPDAINDLGNIIESATQLNVNPNYYGDLHNKGHLLFSYCHDPDYRYKEQQGVMSLSETALRDPIFYRWHAFIDSIFQQYKKRCTPYTQEEREFSGIEITDVKVKGGSDVDNTVRTYFDSSEVDITQGILSSANLSGRKVVASYKHVQHQSFTYEIKVNNRTKKAVVGTVRIFYAPQADESWDRMTFNQQRTFFIELDKFTVNLEPGSNSISRKSEDASVSIPLDQMFMTKEDARNATKDADKLKEYFGYCGCGWPEYLLVGKGTTDGIKCDLFVMITDYTNKDKVDDVEINSSNPSCESCKKSAVSYCGVLSKKYPDKRPMGFPFDRPISDGNAKLADFMTPSQKASSDGTTTEERLKNMYSIEFKVKFDLTSITSSTKTAAS